MIEKTGAIDVYFEDQIEILVEDPEEFPLEALESVLKSKEVKYTNIAHSSKS